MSSTSHPSVFEAFFNGLAQKLYQRLKNSVADLLCGLRENHVRGLPKLITHELRNFTTSEFSFVLAIQ
jgi:hypothetical protein